MSKSNEMRRRLIILSDLWGDTNDEWMAAYTEALRDQFSIIYYDARQLAEIDPELNQESDIHSCFVNGGVEKAVDNLLSLERHSVTVLAFSVGGTIGWKAALKGLKVDTLYAISSTRLRYESQRPNCKTMLFYGERDVYKPGQSWFNEQGITPIILEGVGHDLYVNTIFAKRVSKPILECQNN